MTTVSHATSRRASAYDALPMIRETLARTRSYAATARQTGFPEITIREIMDDVAAADLAAWNGLGQNRKAAA